MLAMPTDENASPQHENVLLGAVKLAPVPLKPVQEESPKRGQKRQLPVEVPIEPLNTLADNDLIPADAPPNKRQRISAWLADSGSRVLAHARPLATRAASGAKGCAKNAATAAG